MTFHESLEAPNDPDGGCAPQAKQARGVPIRQEVVGTGKVRIR